MKPNCLCSTEQSSSSVDLLLEDFDFQLVHDFMTKMDWKWYTPHSDSVQVPSIDRLKSMASMLLMHAYKTGHACSGGFEAFFDPKANKYCLKFVLTKKYS